MRKRPPSLRTSDKAACSSSSLWQTKTPLPAASPSALTTHGALATASARAVGIAGRLQHLLGEGLRALDPRGGRRRPEDRNAAAAQVVGEPGHERHLRPDDDEVDVERPARARAGRRRPPPAPGGSSPARRCPDCRAPRAAPRGRGSARASTRARAHGPPSRRRALSRGESIPAEGRSPRRRRQPREGGQAGRRASRARPRRSAARRTSRICATCEVDASRSLSSPAAVSTAYVMRASESQEPFST